MVRCSDIYLDRSNLIGTLGLTLGEYVVCYYVGNVCLPQQGPPVCHPGGHWLPCLRQNLFDALSGDRTTINSIARILFL